MTLKNKKIIIIRGTSGIGFTTATILAEQGADVIIASRSAEKLAHAKEKLKNQVTTTKLDITQEKQIQDFFANIDAIDHLVITASGNVFGTFKDLTVEGGQRIVSLK